MDKIIEQFDKANKALQGFSNALKKVHVSNPETIKSPAIQYDGFRIITDCNMTEYKVTKVEKSKLTKIIEVISSWNPCNEIPVDVIFKEVPSRRVLVDGVSGVIVCHPVMEYEVLALKRLSHV